MKHVHHWVLESPHGPRTIEGVCRDCEAVREFRAGYEGDFMPGLDPHRQRVYVQRGRVARRGK